MDIDQHFNLKYNEIHIAKVHNFFTYILLYSSNIPDDDVNLEIFLHQYKRKYGYKFDISSHIHDLKQEDFTPYICSYISKHLDRIWNKDFGLEDPDSGIYELYHKSPKLYKKIDMICSIFYCISISNEIVTCTEKLNEQKNKINEQNKEINKNIDNVRDNLLEAKNQIKNQKDNILSEIRSSIYPEIITILGIFTAITFAIFGGMNLLGNLFSRINSTKASLGQTLILAAVFGLTMWGIIELLFYWIAKIKGLSASTTAKHIFSGMALVILVIILIIGSDLFVSGIK